MPYKIKKQKCKQSDGDSGSYVLSYTSTKGKKYNNCHTSKKKAQGQIAAIEGPREMDETDDMALGGGGDPGAEDDEMNESLLRSFIREKLLYEKTYRANLSQDKAAAKIKELASAIPQLAGDQVDRIVFTAKGARLHTKDFHTQFAEQGEVAKKLAIEFAKAINPGTEIDPAQVTIVTGEDTDISRSYPRHLVTFPAPINDSLSIVFASQAAGGARGGGYGYENELFQALEAQKILFDPGTADAAKVDVFVSYTDENGEQQVAAIEAKKQNAKFGEPTMRYNFQSPRGFYSPPTARSKENSDATAELLNSATAAPELTPWMDALKASYENAAKVWNSQQPKEGGKKAPETMEKWTRVPIDIYNIMKDEKSAGRFPFTTTKDIPADASRITSYYQKKNAHYIQIQGKGLYIFSNGDDPLGLQEMLQQAGRAAVPEFTVGGAMANAVASVKASVQTSSGKIIRAVGELSMAEIPESSFSFDDAADIQQLAEWLESRFKKAIEDGEVSPGEEPEIEVSVQVDRGEEAEAGESARLGRNPVVTEAAVRALIRARLTEELTRADKTEIARIFKKEMSKVDARKAIRKEIESATTKTLIDKAFKKNFDKELKKSLGVSFFGTPGKINKFVVDEIHKEVEKILGDAATRELVVQICKDVIIKLYRELSFSYQPVIKRLKV